MCLVSCTRGLFPIKINHWIIQLERARKNRGRLDRNIPCLFNARHQDHDGVDLAPSSHDEDEQEEYFAPTTAGECIQFWPWVNRVSNKHSFALVNIYVGNKTPMTVSPDLPLEIVMQLFKRLGWVNNCMILNPTNPHHSCWLRPRIILVEDHGVLSGLVTVKDVLKYIATERPGHQPSLDERGGLDGLLEEIWLWTSGLLSMVVLWSRRLIRR